jgi:hypothetical protein
MDGAAKGVGMGQSVTSGFLAVRRKGWLKVNDHEDASECRRFSTANSGNNNSDSARHTRLSSLKYRALRAPHRSYLLFHSSVF